MAYKQKKSMIAGTDPVKKAKEKAAPLQKKGWMKRLFSKKKKKNKEETSTEHYKRQIKEKDDYYAAQKELHRLPKR